MKTSELSLSEQFSNALAQVRYEDLPAQTREVLLNECIHADHIAPKSTKSFGTLTTDTSTSGDNHLAPIQLSQSTVLFPGMILLLLSKSPHILI